MSSKKAVELSPKLDWMNAEPQKISEHKGRIVALVFWNSASVFCHNVLADMQQLQRKYQDDLSVLTIHVPKFSCELDSKTLHEVINRLDIQLPVANDSQCITWQHYDILSWPSVVLIDADGIVVAEYSGDNHKQDIESHLAKLLQTIKIPNKPKAKSLQAKQKSKNFNVLSSPSGLLIHKNLLYIADSGHHRILECTLEGNVKRIFGNGLALYLDGNSADASFNRPMGMSASSEYLYVADTRNHAIRRIRLLDGMVDSILGNGKPGCTKNTIVNAFHDVQLNNPSSVVVHQDILTVADSGNNCLCLFNLATLHFSVLAGKGALGLIDGVGTRAEMAHPLALSGTKNHLYVAEGCSSSIRTVAIPEGRVNSLFGLGLYQYGKEDGTRKNASLQHPSAVAVDESRETLWVADSYNHMVRSINLKTNTLGSHAAMKNFGNPCALALDEQSLWIADSASNQIHRYFIATEYLSRISIQMA